mmetsp:Transcript_24982/g.34752  ORF Transcript_24982/g.34752 Transcript_24982/m.34752 type:complete len:210 (+) Transcript_24982:208-837(+)
MDIERQERFERRESKSLPHLHKQTLAYEQKLARNPSSSSLPSPSTRRGAPSLLGRRKGWRELPHLSVQVPNGKPRMGFIPATPFMPSPIQNKLTTPPLNLLDKNKSRPDPYSVLPTPLSPSNSPLSFIPIFSPKSTAPVAVVSRLTENSCSNVRARNLESSHLQRNFEVPSSPKKQKKDIREYREAQRHCGFGRTRPFGAIPEGNQADF